MPTATGTLELMVMGAKIDVDVTVDYTVTHPGNPGQLYGPPEKCWPAEPPEWDLADKMDVTIGDLTYVGDVSELSEYEYKKLNEMVNWYIDSGRGNG